MQQYSPLQTEKRSTGFNPLAGKVAYATRADMLLDAIEHLFQSPCGESCLCNAPIIIHAKGQNIPSLHDKRAFACILGGVFS
ncbi:MAG: hypothetical protein AAFR81_30415 [Chloroflexota bacterium]